MANVEIGNINRSSPPLKCKTNPDKTLPTANTHSGANIVAGAS
jgi:hypothetical protein